MALALKKYTLVPTVEGTLDPRYPDGNAAPSAPVLDTVVDEVSPTQLDITLQTPSSGGVPPLTHVLERSDVAADSGYSVILLGAFNPVTDVHEDAGLTPNTQYWYRAFAYDSNTVVRQSEYSNVVTGITDVASGDVTPPDVPAWSGTGIGGVTATTITLIWFEPQDH